MYIRRGHGNTVTKDVVYLVKVIAESGNSMWVNTTAITGMDAMKIVRERYSKMYPVDKVLRSEVWRVNTWQETYVLYYEVDVS